MKVKNNNPNKPTLRKRTDQNKGGSTDAGGPDTTTSTPAPADTGSDDDKPTLKRRPDDQQ